MWQAAQMKNSATETPAKSRFGLLIERIPPVTTRQMLIPIISTK